MEKKKLATAIGTPIEPFKCGGPKGPVEIKNDKPGYSQIVFELPDDGEKEFQALKERMLAAANSDSVGVKAGDITIDLNSSDARTRLAFKLISDLERAFQNDGRIDSQEGQVLFGDALQIAGVSNLAASAADFLIEKISSAMQNNKK